MPLHDHGAAFRICTMTRQVASPAPRPASDTRGLSRPLRARNLTNEVVERIAGQIRKGRFAPGARLPTEQELMTAMGVSRTVVREAVAALRADGLVTTRQGSGAFVAGDSSRVPFRIDPEGLSSIGDVLEVMELRLAIEVEAAALAATRITPGAPRPDQARAAFDRVRAGQAAAARSTRTSPSIARSRRPPATRASPSCSSCSGTTSSPPERAHVAGHAGRGAALVPHAHPGGARPHLPGDLRCRRHGGAQSHAGAPDAQPLALSAARRTPGCNATRAHHIDRQSPHGRT